MTIANDLHNATPASGAQKGRSPFDGFLGREVTLGVFRCFGCRVWVHQPGKPFVTRRKFAPRAQPGWFLGFERPFGAGVYRVLLDSGSITQSQTVVFDDSHLCRRPCSCRHVRNVDRAAYHQHNHSRPRSSRMQPCIETVTATMKRQQHRWTAVYPRQLQIFPWVLQCLSQCYQVVMWLQQNQHLRRLQWPLLH
jgi:hypothetical protein